ncbi:MAG: FtsQ-type POTRA domain-containing protein [Lentimicrobiaceae bacterium]|jgi:cell division protein FtsQ|nr:FtsQ-type POTRA domain-containing protein [Lentimicrobiaceae bacterium]
MVKRILVILLWLVTAAAIIALFVYMRTTYRNSTIKKLNIEVFPTGERRFINKEEIMQTVDILYDTLCKTLVKDFDPKKADSMLIKNPWIENATVNLSLSGEVKIKIKEYEPIARIFGTQNQTAYIDKKGFLIPVSDCYTPYVPIVSGFLNFHHVTCAHQHISDSAYQNTQLREALEIVQFIVADSILDALVEQIYLNDEGEFELAIRLLNFPVILGNNKQLDEKFTKFKVFYANKLGTEELNKYRKISLKYQNQIVCTKK